MKVSFVPGKASTYANSPTTFLSEPTWILSTCARGGSAAGVGGTPPSPAPPRRGLALKSPTADATEMDAEGEPETVALTVKVEPVFVGTLASTVFE